MHEIHVKFVERKLKTLPRCDIFKDNIQCRIGNDVRAVQPLDHTRFIQKEAEDLLEKEDG